MAAGSTTNFALRFASPRARSFSDRVNGARHLISSQAARLSSIVHDRPISSTVAELRDRLDSTTVHCVRLRPGVWLQSGYIGDYAKSRNPISAPWRRGARIGAVEFAAICIEIERARAIV